LIFVLSAFCAAPMLLFPGLTSSPPPAKLSEPPLLAQEWAGYRQISALLIFVLSAFCAAPMLLFPGLTSSPPLYEKM
ncbi:MAG: hypothetical protein AB7Y74_01975, partial [Syntrophorhabdus sp.]